MIEGDWRVYPRTSGQHLPNGIDFSQGLFTLVVGREGLIDHQDLVLVRGLFSMVGGTYQDSGSPFCYLPQHPTTAKDVGWARVDKNSVDRTWLIQKAVQGSPGLTRGFLFLPRSFVWGVPFLKPTPRYLFMMSQIIFTNQICIFLGEPGIFNGTESGH